MTDPTPPPVDVKELRKIGVETALMLPRKGQKIQSAADELERLRTELAEMRHVVEKLPKTADGVPIVIGDTVWSPKLGGEPFEVTVNLMRRKSISGSSGNTYYKDKLFSTREAAALAQEKQS